MPEARWIDAHCHLADPRIEAELPRICLEAEAAGITSFVQGGVDPTDWGRQRELKARFPGKIVTAYGLHPWWVAARSPRDSATELAEAFAELEKSLGEADALGELGLDFAPRFDSSTHELQSRAFERQLGLSQGLSKPLVLHVVRAHEPALALLQQARKAAGRELKGLVHSFSASREIAGKYLDLGLSLSISGVITRKGFETLRRAVRYIPGDRLMVESDSPDQPPEGWARQWNEPVSILRTAETLAQLRGEKAEDILKASAMNVRRVFGLGSERERNDV